MVTKNSKVCSFCGKGKDEVEQMVAGPNGVFICEINKVGQIKSENVLPDGFNDLIDKCLSDLLDLEKFEIN